MAARFKAKEKAEAGVEASLPPRRSNVYFGAKEVDFVRSGCTLLDCVASGGGKGGWPLGRIVNLVGDKSTGKTLLAIEACANFAAQYPKGQIWYREAEAAFDVSYAKDLGLPVEMIDFGPDGPGNSWSTIEDVFEDLQKCLASVEKTTDVLAKKLREKDKKLTDKEARSRALRSTPPGLYIIDSLDALSSAKEVDRDIREGSYNLEKQKLMGELFRTLVRRLSKARVCVIIISQIRDKIGAMIRGAKYTRSGGKALDFYASLVIYLSDLGKLYRTIRGVKRTTAVKIKAKCNKNKISMPFRECQFTILFGYGIDDEAASVDWLKEVNRLKDAGFVDAKGAAAEPDDLDKVDSVKLREDVVRVWQDIEAGFRPTKSKYGNKAA